MFSTSLFSILSESVKLYCRHLDNITVKGSKEPIGIYTCDLDTSDVKLRTQKTKSKQFNRVKKKKLLSAIRERKVTSF